MAVIKPDNSYMEFPLQISRQYGAPIDKYSVFYSLSAATDYAKTSALAYVGQIISVVDQANKTSTVYQIINISGDLVEVGNKKQWILYAEKLDLKGEKIMANEQIKFLYSSTSNLPGTITNGSLYFHKDRSDQKGGSLYGDFGGSRYKFSGEMRDFGAMPVTAAANDTVATWAALGTGFARYSDTEKHLDGQPSLKGILVQYCSTSDAASIAQN